jgi:hypothetical protein
MYAAAEKNSVYDGIVDGGRAFTRSYLPHA